MILVGDVGGTHTRLALAERAHDGWRITDVEERGTAPDILAAVAGYVQSAGPVQAAAFSGAGPVSADGSIRLTNAGVHLEPAALAAAAGVARAVVVNDFGAIATALVRKDPTVARAAEQAAAVLLAARIPRRGR